MPYGRVSLWECTLKALAMNMIGFVNLFLGTFFLGCIYEVCNVLHQYPCLRGGKTLLAKRGVHLR